MRDGGMYMPCICMICTTVCVYMHVCTNQEISRVGQCGAGRRVIGRVTAWACVGCMEPQHGACAALKWGTWMMNAH